MQNRGGKRAEGKLGNRLSVKDLHFTLGSGEEESGVLARAAKALVDLVLPRTCRVCGARLAVEERHLCSECAGDIPFTYNWMMPRNEMADKFNALIQRDLEHEAAAREAAMGKPRESSEEGYVGQVETDCFCEAEDFGKHTCAGGSGMETESIVMDTEADSDYEAGANGVRETDGEGLLGSVWQVDDAAGVREQREPYAWAVALFYYRSGSAYRNLTRALKYHGDVAIGRWAAGLLAECLAGEVTTPMPKMETERCDARIAECLAGEVTTPIPKMETKRCDARNDGDMDETTLGLNEEAQVKCGNLWAGRETVNETDVKLEKVEVAEEKRWADVDLVVPVPLHWARQWRRGYNQAAIIADVLAAALGAAHEPHLLRRVRRTRSQTRMGASGRAANVSGAFRVNPRVAARIDKSFRQQAFSYQQVARTIAGHDSQSVCTAPVHAEPRHILLVDDVFTTGATINECRRVLRKSYGHNVRISIATLACVG